MTLVKHNNESRNKQRVKSTDPKGVRTVGSPGNPWGFVLSVGYSDLYLETAPDINVVLRRKEIDIANNLVFDRNELDYPISVGWPDNYADVYAWNGANAIEGDPLFVDPAAGDFSLGESSPAIGAGPGGDLAVVFGVEQYSWWKGNFPPRIE